MSEKYELIEIIGQGMYGKVYKAMNKLESKYYAIKALNFKNISTKERSLIETEINLLQELKHPNIVLYKDSFIDKNNNLNIITTFCEGGDMYRKIFKEKNTYFEENIIINWLIQLLLGLSYIHDKKIVHRDIKTKNIFIKNNLTVKIGDFGIAKILNSTSSYAHTFIGTPYYISPELCKDQPYNDKSDVWSLGCVLYELCTLNHPFEGGTQVEIYEKIMTQKFKAISSEYSQELKKMVDLLLEKDEKKMENILSK